MKLFKGMINFKMGNKCLTSMKGLVVLHGVHHKDVVHSWQAGKPFHDEFADDSSHK